MVWGEADMERAMLLKPNDENKVGEVSNKAE